MFFLRWLSLWRIALLLILWFFFLQPMMFGAYNRLLAFYWWMRP